MRISATEVFRVVESQATQKSTPARKPDPVQPHKPDTVQVSQAAQDIARVLAAIQDVPEVREDRVAELKAAVESGRYSVASDVAEMMLRRHNADSLG